MIIEPAFICEKCGSYEIGQENAEKIRKHEKIRIKGVKRNLDGFIAKICDSYSVFRQRPLLSPKHEALYTWDNFHQKTLEQETSGLPRKAIAALESFLITVNPKGGFTAEFILGNTLNRYTELSEREFQRVSNGLKKRYSSAYGNTTFNRTL